MTRLSLALLGLMVVLTFSSAADAAKHKHRKHKKKPVAITRTHNQHSFDQWLKLFKARAASQGIAPETLAAAFEGVNANDEIVRLDRKQPEGKISLEKYLRNTITDRRIERARQAMVDHRDILQQVSSRYGVQPRYIVALWAIESDFGNNMGGFNLFESLGTLAYEGRRAEFFSGELLSALRIMESEGFTPSEMVGSWAGAMGQCQFMPSTYLAHAADGDGDGRRDIWNSEADVFASIASYLHSLNWDDSQEWGRQVRVPSDFKRHEADLKVARTSAQWRARGLSYDDQPVDDSRIPLYAVYPDANSEEVLLVTKNYQAILNWNRSRYFATAVGMLADQIGD